MPKPIEVVTAFIAELGKSPEALRAAFRTWFTPATVWENVGFSITTGIDEAIAWIDRFSESGFATMPVDMLAIIAVGNKVLTERVDHLVNADGTERAIRLMGIFEVEDGHIIAWRDYFDTVALGANGG